MEKEKIANLDKKLLAIVGDFLSEFKSERALSHLTLNASLEKDLGIDSLGRVELFLRIEKAFAVKFEDSLMIEADSLQDIAKALEKANPSIGTTSMDFAARLEETKFDPSTCHTIIDVLLGHVKKEANRPQVYLQDEHGQETVIRYGQLFEMAKKVAIGLHAEGLHRGETVAIMLPTSAQFFYAFLGVLLAGGIPVPIYPPLRADKIEEYAFREASILNNAEVRILITFDKTESLGKLLRVFIKSLNTVATVDYLMSLSGSLPHFNLQSNDPALIQYTSGSTSAPKGVLLSHYNLLSNIRTYGRAIHISPTDVGVSWLPLYHDMGLIGAWLGSLYHAFPLTVLSPLSFLNRPERWLWAIHYHRGTISGGPNFAYELCVRKIDDSSIQGLDLSSWRLAFNGAEAVNPRTLERFLKKFAPYGFKAETLYPVYGLAESTVALTFPPLNRPPKIDTILREPFETLKIAKQQVENDSLKKSEDLLEFVSCGKPLPEHAIRIVDEKGLPVQERIVGSLEFKGPSAMVGYYQNPLETAAVYHDGWWDSGDYAYLAEEEVYITGRKKDIIIKAGRNLYPQEIEEVAAEVHGVRKGCVIAFGVLDPKWGTEKLIVVAETHDVKKEEKQKIRQEITEKISVILAIPPDEVILIPMRTIPKTSSGKLQRSLCKQYYLEGKLGKSKLPIQIQFLSLFLKGFFISLSKYFQKLLQGIYTLYVALLLLIFIPILMLGVNILPPLTSATFARFLMRLLLFFAAVPIKVDGKENLKTGIPTIYIANHASYIDSLILFSILPANVAIVGKKELEKWPIIKTLVKKLKFPTVDRLDFTKSLKDTDNLIHLLKEGRSLAIFPEGTFSYALGLRPFKLGAFKIAVDTKTPICPIALQGTRGYLRGNRLLLMRQAIQVSIGEVITPKGQDWNEVMDLHAKTRAFIEKNCGELSIDLVAATVVKPDSKGS